MANASISDIERKLNDEELEIWAEDRQRKFTSMVWQHFDKIREKEHLNLIPFVQCKNCKKIPHHKDSSGTSTLKYHSKICNETKGSSITNESTPSSSKQYSAQRVKSVLTEKFVEMSCLHLRPFKMVEDSGFQRFCQEIIDIGAKFGHIDIKEILPCSTTVSRNIAKKYDNVVKTILPEVKTAINKGKALGFIFYIFVIENDLLKQTFKS